jgi:hypothetical protein
MAPMSQRALSLRMMVDVVALDRLMPGSHSGKNSGAPDPRFL